VAGLLTWLERKYPWMYGHNTFVTETLTGARDLAHLGVPREHIREIPPGIDTELFRPGKKTERPSLVYFGGMRDYKRHLLAVEVMTALARNDDTIVMTVIGERKALERMKEMSGRYGLDSRITFTGQIPDGKLADIVAASWVNLHFSMTEGFSLSILEAAAAGMPTVALDATGVSEVVAEYGLGKTTKELNEFQAALRCILRDI
jgi:glycosyltransferase involved in cell wall biosynthesis